MDSDCLVFNLRYLQSRNPEKLLLPVITIAEREEEEARPSLVLVVAVVWLALVQ